MGLFSKLLNGKKWSNTLVGGILGKVVPGSGVIGDALLGSPGKKKKSKKATATSHAELVRDLMAKGKKAIEAKLLGNGGSPKNFTQRDKKRLPKQSTSRLDAKAETVAARERSANRSANEEQGWFAKTAAKIGAPVAVVIGGTIALGGGLVYGVLKWLKIIR